MKHKKRGQTMGAYRVLVMVVLLGVVGVTPGLGQTFSGQCGGPCLNLDAIDSDQQSGWADCFNLYEFDHSTRNLGMGGSRFLSNPAMLGWSKQFSFGFDYRFDRNRLQDYTFAIGNQKTEYQQDLHWFYPRLVIPTGFGSLAMSYLSSSQDSGPTSFRNLNVDQFQLAWGFALNDCLSVGHEFIYMGRNEGSALHEIQSDESFITRLGVASRCGLTYTSVSGFYMVDNHSYNLKGITLDRENVDRDYYGFDVGFGAVSDYGLVGLSFEYDYLKDRVELRDAALGINQNTTAYDRVIRAVMGGECHLNEAMTARGGLAYNATEDDDFLSLNTGMSWWLNRNVVLEYGFEGRMMDTGFNTSHAVGCSYRF